MLPKQKPWKIVEIVNVNIRGGVYELLDPSGVTRERHENPKKLASKAFNFYNADSVEHAYDLRKVEDAFTPL